MNNENVKEAISFDEQLKGVEGKVTKVNDLILLNNMVLVVPINNAKEGTSSGEKGRKIVIAKAEKEEDEMANTSIEITYGKVVKVAADIPDTIIKQGVIVFFGRYDGRDLDINGVITRLLFYSELKGIADVEIG